MQLPNQGIEGSMETEFRISEHVDECVDLINKLQLLMQLQQRVTMKILTLNGGDVQLKLCSLNLTGLSTSEQIMECFRFLDNIKFIKGQSFEGIAKGSQLNESDDKYELVHYLDQIDRSAPLWQSVIQRVCAYACYFKSQLDAQLSKWSKEHRRECVLSSRCFIGITSLKFESVSDPLQFQYQQSKDITQEVEYFCIRDAFNQENYEFGKRKMSFEKEKESLQNPEFQLRKLYFQFNPLMDQIFSQVAPPNTSPAPTQVSTLSQYAQSLCLSPTNSDSHSLASFGPIRPVRLTNQYSQISQNNIDSRNRMLQSFQAQQKRVSRSKSNSTLFDVMKEIQLKDPIDDKVKKKHKQGAHPLKKKH